jgi:hypothetical protein
VSNVQATACRAHRALLALLLLIHCERVLQEVNP